MTTSIKNISVGKDFSKVPAGRFYSDGPASGQAFREKFLVPALQSNSTVVVSLDDTEGYGSSFLEEAFGGLIRVHGFGLADLHQQLVIKSLDDPTLVEEVASYIGQAAG